MVVWIHSREALECQSKDSGFWSLCSQETLKLLFGHRDVMRVALKTVKLAVA